MLQRMLEIFYSKKLDVVVIGLENRYDAIPWGDRHSWESGDFGGKHVKTIYK